MNFGKVIQEMSSGLIRLEYKGDRLKETRDETVKEHRVKLLKALIIILKSLGFCPAG